MEKFAVDLDKVLDEFEFNEDCAEQVASVEPTRPGVVIQPVDSANLQSDTRPSQDDRNFYKSPSKSIDTLDIRKSEMSHGNGDSVNDFSPHDYQDTDDKVQKFLVDFHDTDPVPLTIHNDITHNKFAKKHQNDKNHNSYDKRLNQPNIKPSVSNVFSSLNEYINASSANMDRVDTTTTESNIKSQDDNKTEIKETTSSETNEMNKFTNVLPEYQNILLPIKCDSGANNRFQESKADESQTICKIDRSQKLVPQTSNYVYENIPIGGNQEIVSCDKSRPENVSRSSSQEETKHVYENIDFDQQPSCVSSDKDAVSKRISMGNKSDLPDSTMEHENPMIPGASNPVTLVFQNVNIAPQVSKSTTNVVPTNRKPIGFSSIDDLSEEELNKYLADLEAEERAKEVAVVYENVSIPSSSFQPENRGGKINNQHEDEDANEAPIFESVTIGELPQVSEEKLQEKAKKFPVIDYSQSGVSEPSDFLEKQSMGKVKEVVRTVTEVKNRNTRKTGEIVRKSSNEVNEVSSKLEDVTLNVISEIEKSDSQEQNITEITKNAEQVSSTDEQSREDEGNCSLQIQTNLEVSESSGEFGESPVEVSDSNENQEEVEETEHSEDESPKPPRPQTLDIVSSVSMDESSTTGSPSATAGTQEQPLPVVASSSHERDPSPDASDNSSMDFGIVLGKQPPFWVPDADAPNCMLCEVKFNVIKRRHHCRACGKVLCNKCCSMKYRLEYQGNMDSRVCSPCYQQLIQTETDRIGGEWPSYTNAAGGSVNSPQGRQPNPSNPMEYCSTIPPLQQLVGMPVPPSVMVPVGVLKREGGTKQRAEGQKFVMFSDGIRPGCDLTELDATWDPKPPYRKLGTKRITSPRGQSVSTAKKQNLPPLDSQTNSYVPQEENLLPPTVTIHKGQITYHEVVDPVSLYESLKNECDPPVMFAINRNLYAYVKITNLNCCVNRICWNVTSRGLACVGQDEVILLVETLPDETQIPKDLLIHINQIYMEAIKGNTITELTVSIHQGVNLLGSREHAGFLFIRQTFQCLQKIVLPPAPFLVGLLVHRWETPWAKIFPLRLVLRLGAEYRYYPCPLVSVRFRDAVYFEIGHTIMKVLADFRNYAYTLPGVRGLIIHMQDRTTDVLLPKNRYDQVIKGLNNSNDHVLAFASNFSVHADSHLVCIQTNTGDESNYQTQAINIHNKPRKVTGASFVVINGALKSSMGLSAKSSIVEDGLMVQIMPEKMEALKAALKNMQDFSIGCGKQGAAEPDETVNIKWVENDVHFNLGVKSPIDGIPMDGIPSIRVHNGTDYMGTSRFIRWTEVFIIKSDDHPNGVHDPIDINKLSESISRATCAALVKLLDLLATAGLTKLAVRTTIHPDNVGYEAGSEGTRLPPIYMNSLDNELIQVLHKAAQSSQDANTVLELIFHVLDD